MRFPRPLASPRVTSGPHLILLTTSMHQCPWFPGNNPDTADRGLPHYSSGAGHPKLTISFTPLHNPVADSPHLTDVETEPQKADWLAAAQPPQ